MSRRDEIRKYEADVAYDVWRSGGNPDLVGERTEDDYWDGYSQEEAYRREMLRQAPAEPDSIEQQWEEQEPWQEEPGPFSTDVTDR